MTLEQLEQYADLRKEVRMYARKLDELRNKATSLVTDIVVGSSAEYPYTAHPVSVTGVSAEIELQIKREAKRYRDHVLRLHREVEEVEDFIDSLRDSRLRQIITYRYIDGCEWADIALKLGGEVGEDAVRKKVERDLKKLSRLSDVSAS